jgi:hypothetical protein
MMMMIGSQEKVSKRFPYRSQRRTPVILCALLGLVLLAFDARADDGEAKQAPAGKPRVPMASTEGPTKRIEGKIMRSSRGKKGPVRLLVERKEGEPITVLVAPEEVCDRLGLSLKTDEQVVVEGSLLKSDRPILIATAFIVDGKTVHVRDAEGKIVDPGLTGDKPSGAAVIGGGKNPEPSPKP